MICGNSSHVLRELIPCCLTNVVKNFSPPHLGLAASICMWSQKLPFYSQSPALEWAWGECCLITVLSPDFFMSGLQVETFEKLMNRARLRVSVNCDWMEGSFWFLKKLFIVVSFFYLTGIMGNYLLSSVLIILLNFFVVVSVERFYIL